MLLRSAGIPHEAMGARVDEDTVKAALISEGATPRDIADTLAELKAQKVANRHPEALVLGSDQVLALKSELFSKADSKGDLVAQLAQLQGQTHILYSAAVLYEGMEPVWRHVGAARMTMRALSHDYIADYVDTFWDEIQYCVGGYRAEAEGIRLFTQIVGDMPTIMGLPLLPLQSYLATRGVISQ